MCSSVVLQKQVRDLAASFVDDALAVAVGLGSRKSSVVLELELWDTISDRLRRRLRRQESAPPVSGPSVQVVREAVLDALEAVLRTPKSPAA